MYEDQGHAAESASLPYESKRRDCQGSLHVSHLYHAGILEALISKKEKDYELLPVADNKLRCGQGNTH